METASTSSVIVVGRFDRLLFREMRFLQEAAVRGPVHVQLWSDAVTTYLTGEAPKFTEAERLYVLEALRYVDRITICDRADQESRLPVDCDVPGATWVVDPEADRPENVAWCQQHGLNYRVIPEEVLASLSDQPSSTDTVSTSEKKVIVTGCYDWFHSGHVRFFEEVSQLGQLYVIVGHDDNIRLLKGEGHPMFPAEERCFIAGSVKHVHQALVSSGEGWLDAEPEIQLIQPDMYVVNEDGDRPEKREYCETHGIEYRVLKRIPKEGLPRRQSTDLRGF